MFLQHKFKIALLTSMVLSTAFTTPLMAEDCTGTLPGANCTLDEDTTAPLTIDNGVTLTIGGSVTIDETINGSTNAGDGTVQTNSGSVNVNQTAAIGNETAIDDLVIGDGDTWTTSASITTNNDGGDIDLGAGDGGEVLNFNGGASYTGEIDGHAGDSVNIGANGLGGTFQGNGSMQTITLNVVSGDFETSSGLGDSTALGGLNVANGASLSSTSDIVVGGATDIDGRISIGANDSLTTNTYVVDADDAEFVLGVRKLGGTTTVGSIVIQNGGAVDLSNDVVRFNVEIGSEAIETQTISNVVTGNTGPTIAPTINDNLYLYDFSFAQDVNDLDLNIIRNSLESSTTTTNNLNSARVLLEDGVGIANADVQAAQVNLNNASTREEFNALLESTQPPANGSTSVSTRMIAAQTNRIIHDRLSTSNTDFSSVKTVSLTPSKKVRSSERYIQDTEVEVITIASIEPAAGDSEQTQDDNIEIVPNRTRELAERRKRLLEARMRNTNDDIYEYEKEKKEYDYDSAEAGFHAWSQAFVMSANQAERGGLGSYDVDGAGVSLGIDTGDMHENITVGTAFTYSNTNVDATNSNADNDTYQVSLYGAYQTDNDYYLSGVMSYALSDIQNYRSNLGGTSTSAFSHHDAEQISLSGAIGKNYILNNKVLIQPSLQVDYSVLQFEEYSEEGGSGLALNVSESSLNSLSAGPYLKVASRHELESGAQIAPEFGVGYSYEFIQDEARSLSGFQSFPDDKTVLTQGFDAQAHKIDLDLGLNLEIDEFYGKVNYNFDYQEDLTGHVGSVTAGYRF